jgi:hypothetical protein
MTIVIRHTLELDNPRTRPWLRSTGLIDRVDPFIRLLFDPRDNSTLSSPADGNKLWSVYTFVGAVIIPGSPAVDAHYFTQLCP